MITSDHAEISRDQARDCVQRLTSFYDDIQHIPMIMYVPKSLKLNTKSLKFNTQRNVQNLDVLPTLLDLLNISTPDNVKSYAGNSLLKPISDRVISSINVNDFRDWSSSGFGLFYKQYRLVVSSFEGVQLFDVINDPDQIHSIWNSAASDLRCKFITEIYNKKYLLSVWAELVDKEGDDYCFD